MVSMVLQGDRILAPPLYTFAHNPWPCKRAFFIPGSDFCRGGQCLTKGARCKQLVAKLWPKGWGPANRFDWHSLGALAGKLLPETIFPIDFYVGRTSLDLLNGFRRACFV